MRIIWIKILLTSDKSFDVGFGFNGPDMYGAHGGNTKMDNKPVQNSGIQ